MSDDDFAGQDWQDWAAGRKSHFVQVTNENVELVVVPVAVGVWSGRRVSAEVWVRCEVSCPALRCRPRRTRTSEIEYNIRPLLQ